MAYTYTLAAGRCIVRDGVPIATIHKVGNPSDGYALAPSEADTLARDIVASLNAPPSDTVARLAEAKGYAEGIRDAENLDYETGFADGCNDSAPGLIEAAKIAEAWLTDEGAPERILAPLRAAIAEATRRAL